MLKLDQPEISSSSTKFVPSHGWALANIVNLATDSIGDHSDSGHFIPGLDCKLYVQVVNSISENLLCWIENSGCFMQKDNEEFREKDDFSSRAIELTNHDKLKSLFIDLLKPVHQQWHLRKLQALVMKKIPNQELDAYNADQYFNFSANFELLNVIFFYYHLLRIFSSLNHSVGSLPILNLLSFTPGFLVELWETLEASIFHGTTHISHDNTPPKDDNSGYHGEASCSKKHIRVAKESGSKWANILQKFAGKSADMVHTDLSSNPINSSQTSEDAYDLWDIEAVRGGAQGVTKDLSCMLHLFCAVYAHLLLVLDDIEFYEKQVYWCYFSLERSILTDSDYFPLFIFFLVG